MMKKVIIYTFLYGLIMCKMVSTSAISSQENDVDAVDTEDVDTEAAAKCDACVLIASKFGESFQARLENAQNRKLTDQDISEAAESVCDSPWTGYAIAEVEGASRLAGPGTGRDSSLATDKDNMWSHRLQDFCDELLAEIPSDRVLYESWSINNQALEDILCKREATFSACANENWGPWPGDDYFDEDYDDDDFEYIHDEF